MMESSQESIDSSKYSTDDSKGSSSGLKKSGDEKTTARIKHRLFWSGYP
jgi:hypothetical protein